MYANSEYYNGLDGRRVLISRKMRIIPTLEGYEMKFYEFHGKRNLCGDRIREARLKQRLSQSELSTKLQLKGITVERDTISRMESGSRFVADFEVVTIAEVLEVPILWLLGKE